MHARHLHRRCGWTYFHIDRYAEGPFIKKPVAHKTRRRPANYLYRSPCGRSLLTLDEVQDYLLTTNSKLTIKFFIEDRATSLNSSFPYDETYVLHSDISEGKERVRISVYNENHPTLPEPFVYGTDTHWQFSPTDIESTMTCCSCTDEWVLCFLPSSRWRSVRLGIVAAIEVNVNVGWKHSSKLGWTTMIRFAVGHGRTCPMNRWSHVLVTFINVWKPTSGVASTSAILAVHAIRNSAPIGSCRMVYINNCSYSTRNGKDGVYGFYMISPMEGTVNLRRREISEVEGVLLLSVLSMPTLENWSLKTWQPIAISSIWPYWITRVISQQTMPTNRNHRRPRAKRLKRDLRVFPWSYCAHWSFVFFVF